MHFSFGVHYFFENKRHAEAQRTLRKKYRIEGMEISYT